MSIGMTNDTIIPENFPSDTDSRDESIASQEEVFHEKTEETLRADLIAEDPSAYVEQGAGCVDCCCVVDNLEEELDHAAEELITGDSDDPPLSEEDVVETLRMTSNARRLEAWEKEIPDSRRLEVHN